MNQPERRAYLCAHKGHADGNVYRVFLQPGEPVPKCPEHNTPMQRQVNLAYKRPDVSTPIGRSRMTTGRTK